MSKLILASASPRRKELLRQIGLSFRTMPGRGEEITDKEEPRQMVEELSYRKAVEVMSRLEGQMKEDYTVIGADTMVSLWGKTMGKPRDREDAFRMLNLLQGNTHQVYTGVTLCWKKGAAPSLFHTFSECTEVTMYPMSAEEINSYIDTGEPMDKAGAYGIQGRCAAYIESILGDYNNVVGLPVGRLYQELKARELV